MTTTKHTPGPWTAHSAVIRQDSRRMIAVCRMAERSTPDDPHNAARIVACVNACEGFEDPAALADLVVAAAWLLERTTPDTFTREPFDRLSAALVRLAPIVNLRGGSQ